MNLRSFRPHFTLRWLMIAVAIVAVGLGWVGWVERRRGRFQRLSQLHAGKSFAITRFPGVGSSHPKFVYHRMMMSKYQDAADHPWAIVSPDPPVPSGPD